MCSLVVVPSPQNVMAQLSVSGFVFLKLNIHKRTSARQITNALRQSNNGQTVIDAGPDGFIGVLSCLVFRLVLFHSPRIFQKIA